MHPRIRRLEADYQRTMDFFSRHSAIHLAEVEGTPPERYIFQFNIQGLREQAEDAYVPVPEHRAEVFLPMDYPRRPPFCRMLTPVFHPNIDSQKICIGDHWSAGQALEELVIRIGEMICYQNYNTKSPLNAKAAAWVEENMDDLPLDNTDLSALSPDATRE